jgi:hypothetical protein
MRQNLHPSIMNRNQAISVSFRVRNTDPVQYHFVLEETGTCDRSGFHLHLICQRAAVPNALMPPSAKESSNPLCGKSIKRGGDEINIE